MKKRIISFSLWGDKPLYIQGALRNIELQKQIYPDWICRFYIDSTISEEIKEQFISSNCEIIIKEDNILCSGAFWRYEALFDDSDIEYVIFRDTDSRLTVREKMAVDEWLSSSFSVHIMRDWPGHIWNIMGGMWGINLTKTPVDFVKWFKEEYYKYITDVNEFKYGGDENFLKTLVWSKVCNDNLSHISFNNLIKTGKEKPFPITWENEYSFIGNKFDENDKGIFSLKNVGAYGN